MREYRHHINVSANANYVVQFENWTQGGPAESVYDGRDGRRLARCTRIEDAQRIVRALQLLDTQEAGHPSNV